MFRSALVGLKPTAEQKYLIEFAASLAARFKLQLTGVSVIDEHRVAAPEPVPLGGGAFKSELDQQRVEDARRGAAEATAALIAVAGACGITVDAEVCDGDVVQQLVRRVNTADCLICGHKAGGDASEHSLLNSILKHIPRPAIVVPDAPWSGQSIMVAYDGSFQASRALGEFANSGLDDGRSVTVVSLHHDLQEAQRLAAEGVASLRRHEITATPHGAALQGKIGAQLLEVARRLDAGLLVMGAFGHIAVREFLFGSTSREILDMLPLPVFLDH